MSKKYQIKMTTLARQQILQMGKYIIEEHNSPEAAFRLIDMLEQEIKKLRPLTNEIVRKMAKFQNMNSGLSGLGKH